MEFKIIEYNSRDYQQMVDLRDRILRAPINSVATAEELAEDEYNILLGAFHLNEGGIVGCCFLSPIDKETLRLRQMAVDSYYQGKGLGKELIDYAERITRLRGYQQINLHARETAIDFYKKQGFMIISDPFIEVGISHVEMTKNVYLEN